MIIDTSQSNIKTYGDIKEFKTSIDPKNLEFITTLLSSNLYSAPEQSFIREIVSNAWDSHVEAGTTDTPVIIKFTKHDSYNFSVAIRDYGTGISPERFKEVFCNIGSSTKRESNEFIGGFGLGKYSSLACSNTVYITSYYEGTSYYYVMIKDGNSITINLLMEKPTSERNGVEVVIKNIKDIVPYTKALDYIVFFPNVYLKWDYNNDFNKIKIKRFNNFVAATSPIHHKLLLGNVLYPCNKTFMDDESKDFLNRIDATGIVIKFEVGELNITPNRESIIYTSDTIKKIEDRIKAAKNELDKKAHAKIVHDYDDIKAYYEAISRYAFYNPIEDELTPYIYLNYRITPNELKNDSITYKGVDLRRNEQYIHIILHSMLINFKCSIYRDKIYEKGNIDVKNTFKADKILILNKDTRLTKPVKTYLKNTWEKYAVITQFTFDEFKKYIEEIIDRVYDVPAEDSVNLNLIIKGFYDLIINKAISVDLNTDDGYLEVKKSLQDNKRTIIDDKEVILYVYATRALYKERKYFNKFTQAVEFIKKCKKGIVLANMDVDESMLWHIVNCRGLLLIKARKDVIAKLKMLNLRCIVDIEYLINDDPALKKAAAINKIFPKGIDVEYIPIVFKNIPRNLHKEFMKVYLHYCKYLKDNMYYGIALKAANKDNYDPYTLYICKILNKYIESHKTIENLIGCNLAINDSIPSNIKDAITTALIVKTKAYRVSATAYINMKTNPLIKILCKK